MAKDCPTHPIDGYRAAPPVRRPRCVTRLVRPRRHDRARRLVYDPGRPIDFGDEQQQGTGSALVDAASEHATHLASLRETVHSGRKAVPVCERQGFESSRQLLQRPPNQQIAPRADHMCSVWRGAARRGRRFARLGVLVANTADLDTRPVHQGKR